jgi:ATP-binding cassette, subfamily B, multidrug efflux pump
VKGRFSADSPSSANDWQLKNSSPWNAVSLIKPYLRRYALRIVMGFIALIAVDFLQLWIPRIIKNAVDDLQQGIATSSGLITYGGYIVLIALAIAMLRFVWRELLLGFSRLLEMHLRNRMMSHVLTLDRAFFQRRTTGDIMALTTNDLSAVQLATGMGLVAAVDALFMGLAAIGFMAYIDWRLTLIAMAPMPFLAVFTRFLASRLHRRFKSVQEQFSTLTEFVRSSFSSIRLVKAYNQEGPQSARFNQLGEAYVRNNLRLAMVNGTLFPLSGMIGNLSLLLVVYFGGRMAIDGAITVGDFVAFITYLFMMTWPMMALGWVADLFQRGVTSLDRINALLLERPGLIAPVKGTTAVAIKGGISIRNLSFAYPYQKQPVLTHISIDIRPGRFIGVVGRTGSGKTTLCQLLARLYPVPDGTIFFDGKDVNRISLEDVRGAIAYVPQEVILFSDSVAFNITMGRKDATREEIEAAAKAAAIHDEIMEMSEGYRTRIGERGVKLSGGQRQRLAIARALLLDRPIIIIDDGLSAVDMETEHAIIRSIASYLKGHTCIIVSHRIAPVVDAEEIVVMDDGRIIERGTHSELLEKSSFYATIYRQQTSLPGPFEVMVQKNAT